jgi:hypothetical protein
MVSGKFRWFFFFGHVEYAEGATYRDDKIIFPN